jgi:hypothetical protein
MKAVFPPRERTSAERRPERLFLPRVVVFLLVAGISAGCGGGGGGADDGPEFDGLWTARFNPIDDGCFLLDPALTGFVDQYVVTQAGSEVTVRSTEGFVTDARGTVNPDRSFVVEQTLEGDPFGIGLPCVTRVRLRFENLNDSEDRADTLLSLDRSCEDGTVCSTTAVGSAVEEPL